MKLTVPNELDAVVDLSIPTPNLSEVIHKGGIVDLVPEFLDIKTNGVSNITWKVISTNPDLKKRKSIISMSNTYKYIKTGNIEKWYLKVDVEQSAREESEVEKAEKEDTDKKKKAKELKDKAMKKGGELAQKALGGAVTTLVSVAATAVEDALLKIGGIDLIAAQAKQGILGLEDQLKKQTEALLKAKEAKKKMEESESKGRKVSEKLKDLKDDQINKLQDSVDDLEKQLAEKIKESAELPKKLLEDLKNSSIAQDMQQAVDDIKVNGAAAADASTAMMKSVATVATEGTGASQVGTAGPYPAVTTTTTPSPTQIAGTVNRMLSQGKAIADPIQKICQAAGKLYLPESVIAPLSTTAEMVGTISSLSV